MASFVIVPGACTPATLFQDFDKFASSQGVEVITVQLATVGRDLSADHVPTVADDVQAISRVVEPLLEAGKEVILVASSLGGAVATQCLEVLCTKARTGQGKNGGIDTIVYVSAMILEPDTSPLDLFGPDPPPVVNSLDGHGYIEFTTSQEDGTITFSDLPADEAKRLRQKMTRYHSRKSFETKLTYPGYRHVDKVHYVICELDQVINKESQLALIETLKSCRSGYGTGGNSGDGVITHVITAAHVPFVSRPQIILDKLREIAEWSV